MIDDLVTKIPREPYRMFTSRAEYRLALREDNARERLIHYGRRLGLVEEEIYERYLAERESVDKELRRLGHTLVPVSAIVPSENANGDKQSIRSLLGRPNIRYRDFAPYDTLCASFPDVLAGKVEIEIKYAGYIEKQQREIERFRELESKSIPETFDVKAVRGLKNEAIDVLQKYRPLNLGQASRLAGITFSDVALLLVHLKRHRSATVSRETS